MTNEETSAYLLIAAGIFWVFVGMIGLMQAPGEEGNDGDEDLPASADGKMTKLPRSADELRIMVLAEAARQPVCPPDIDIAIRSDADFGWRADLISAPQVGSADCAQAIGVIVQRLRRHYELE
jgi:hypothetical protein